MNDADYLRLESGTGTGQSSLACVCCWSTSTAIATGNISRDVTPA